MLRPSTYQLDCPSPSGKQSKPTSTSPPGKTAPRRPATVLTDGLAVLDTELQHWTGPVEHEDEGGGGVPEGSALRASAYICLVNERDMYKVVTNEF